MVTAPTKAVREKQSLNREERRATLKEKKTSGPSKENGDEALLPWIAWPASTLVARVFHPFSRGKALEMRPWLCWRTKEI